MLPSPLPIGTLSLSRIPDEPSRPRDHLHTHLSGVRSSPGRQEDDEPRTAPPRVPATRTVHDAGREPGGEQAGGPASGRCP